MSDKEQHKQDLIKAFYITMATKGALKACLVEHYTLLKRLKADYVEGSEILKKIASEIKEIDPAFDTEDAMGDFIDQNLDSSQKSAFRELLSDEFDHQEFE